MNKCKRCKEEDRKFMEGTGEFSDYCEDCIKEIWRNGK